MLQRIVGSVIIHAAGCMLWAAHLYSTCVSLLQLLSKMQVQNPWKTIMTRKYRPQLVLAIASTFFQQWSGINTIIFYAPQLFVSLGVGQGAALGATIVTGIVNHIATYVSFHVADKYGRRILFIEGKLSDPYCLCVSGLLSGLRTALIWTLGVMLLLLKGTFSLLFQHLVALRVCLLV